MQIFDVIERRRTVHEYASGPLPVGLLERALTAALSAPNHGLTEPWRFVRIGPETRRALIHLGIDLATNGGEVALSQQALARLIERANSQTTAIMCSEAVPWRCHRQLIADALVARGIEVRDILSATRADPHALNPVVRARKDGVLVYAERSLFDEQGEQAPVK